MRDFRIYKPGEDAGDIYAFRYRIYEEEMRRNDEYSDHKRKIITDSLDRYAYNIAALQDDKIIGVVRVNFCADGDPGFYREFLELESVGADYPGKVSFSTRLMVTSSERRKMLPVRLSAECFKLAIARKTLWSFCDCNQPLVPFFEKLCFEVQNPHKFHPVYGDVAVMRINLSNPKIYDKRHSIIARFLDGPPE